MLTTMQVGCNLTALKSKLWTREQKDAWLKANPPTIQVLIGGQLVTAVQKESKTSGSVGYYGNGKIVLTGEATEAA